MTIQQSHFRIRPEGGTETINANAAEDWEAALDVDVTLDMLTIHAGLLCGIRFELEEIVAASTTITPKLQYRVNAGTWTDCGDATAGDTYIDPNINTNLFNVIVVNKDDIADGAATTNILGGSALAFVAGTGEHDTVAANTTLNNEHTEIEWRVLIRLRYIAQQEMSDGDEVEFRVVESDDTILGGTYVIPKITVNIPVGYIGGTGIETSANFNFIKIPDGTLYAPIEDTEVDAAIVMLKSVDGGDLWLQQDSATVLVQNDMESWAMAYDDTNKVIHCLHIGGDGRYLQWATKDHATETPDTWIHIGADPDFWSHILNGSIDAVNQCSDLVLRGSTLYAFYADLITTDQVVYRKKPDLTATDNWGSETTVDATGGTTDFAGVAAVLGPNSDLIHIFYTDYSNLDAYYVSLNTSDVLGTRRTITNDLDDQGAGVPSGLTNAVSWYNGSSEKTMIGFGEAANSYLSTRIAVDDTSLDSIQIASNNVVILDNPTSVNARQPVASLGIDTSTDIAYAFYSDDATMDLWRASNADGASWTGHTEEQDGVIVHAIRGQVFTHGTGIHGGDTVYGYIWDTQYNQGDVNAKSGYSGTNRYDEFQIAEGAVDVADSQAAYAEGLRVFPFSEDFSVGGDGDDWRKSHWVTGSG